MGRPTTTQKIETEKYQNPLLILKWELEEEVNGTEWSPGGSKLSREKESTSELEEQTVKLSKGAIGTVAANNLLEAVRAVQEAGMRVALGDKSSASSAAATTAAVRSAEASTSKEIFSTTSGTQIIFCTLFDSLFPFPFACNMIF